MLRIIRFRPLEFKDTQFGRLLKPFEDAGLVDVFENTEINAYQMVYDLCQNTNEAHYHFSHFLNVEKMTECPQTVYEHLLAKDETIPTLCSVWTSRTGKKSIYAIRDYHELQQILGYAVDRGLITNASRLL